MKSDFTADQPLYALIREDIRHSIMNGTLKPGDRLPPVTEMALRRDVTAATIRRALQDLTDEGLISSHVGRGTFVAQAHPHTNANHTETSPSRTGQNSSRRLRETVTQSLGDLMALAQRPGVISFTRGIADPDTVEEGILSRLAHKALADGEELFRDHGDPRGLPGLRTAIAALYAEQGITVTPEQVLVTSGSQQAVALVAQQAAENRTKVFCETPCYNGVTNAFSAFNVDVETVIRDAEGPATGKLGDTPALFYLCPILHNPMGTDIKADKQTEIADWARRTGSVLLSDEVFRDLHPGANAPPSFLANPGPDRAIVLGSLSKSFISGLRVGWLVTSEERVRALTRIKKAMDLGCPPLMQGIAEAFLTDPEGYYAHRDRVRVHYRKLRDTALAALDRHMPRTVQWTKPEGGFQLWVSLGEGYSSVELFMRAIDKGVAFLPGPLQDPDGRFLSSFRLCYGSLTPEEITEGIKRLGEAVKEYVTQSPGEAGLAGLGDF